MMVLACGSQIAIKKSSQECLVDPHPHSSPTHNENGPVLACLSGMPHMASSDVCCNEVIVAVHGLKRETAAVVVVLV